MLKCLYLIGVPLRGGILSVSGGGNIYFNEFDVFQASKRSMQRKLASVALPGFKKKSHDYRTDIEKS